MRTVSHVYARDHYAEILDAVLGDREEIVIESVAGAAAVVVARADYESLKETVYLLQEPANARRLLASIEKLDAESTIPDFGC